MGLLVVLIMDLLRYDHVSNHVGYHFIGTRIIRRVTVTAVTSADQAVLTWSGVLVVVVGWMFGGIGCHTISKGVELSF